MNKTLRHLRIVIAIFLFLPVFLLNAQEKVAVPIPVEKLCADLDTLYKTILISHPDPGGFLTREQFDFVYDSLRASITEPQNAIDFSELIAKFIGSMSDSHTSLDYAQFAQWSFQKNKFVVPFASFSEQGKIYFHHDWEDKIPGGSELLSINGKDVKSLWEKALLYSCKEGSSVEPQIRIADAIMPVLASLLAPADSVNSFVVISSITGIKETYLLQGLTEKEYKRKKKERMLRKENQTLDFTFNDSNMVATLRIGTFAPSNGRAYQKFIRKSFQEIAREGCDSLILDIRGNGGGSSNQVEYLYSFLDTAGYNTPANVISLKSPLALKRVRPMTKKATLFILRNFFKKNEDIQGFIRMIDLPMGGQDTAFFKVKKKQKEELVFTGNCALLINGLTASAGVDFTNAFQKNKRGLIVGEPCLGPTTGTWGNPATFVLPESKIRLTISTIRYNYDNSFMYDDKALQPDILILPNCNAALDKKDEVLEFLKNGW
ncbi:MAG: S41 family peptidase [Flavobacteriales bacterium]